MNRLLVSAAAGAALVLIGSAGASAATAKHHVAATPKPNVEVTQRDARGHATNVRIDGQEYALCSKTVTDSCINPHDAGFNWGNTPLNYWPGKPASEVKGKLPAKAPA